MQKQKIQPKSLRQKNCIVSYEQQVIATIITQSYYSAVRWREGEKNAAWRSLYVCMHH